MLLAVGLAHGEEYVSRQRRAHIGPGHQDSQGHPVHPDLHSGEHCVDVSFWGNLTYEPSQETCCETVLQKHCHDKEENVSCKLEWELVGLVSFCTDRLSELCRLLKWVSRNTLVWLNSENGPCLKIRTLTELSMVSGMW